MNGRTREERAVLRRALIDSGGWPAQLYAATMPLAVELQTRLGPGEVRGLAELVHELIAAELERQRARTRAPMRKLA